MVELTSKRMVQTEEASTVHRIITQSFGPLRSYTRNALSSFRDISSLKSVTNANKQV